MKVEHLTVGGNTVIRDTADILPTTVEAFKTFEVNAQSFTYSPKGLGLNVKVSLDKNVFVFDVLDKRQIITFNVCSRGASGQQQAIAFIKQVVDNHPLWASVKIVNPSQSRFIYTVIITPTTPDKLKLAGEIELYVFNEILKAL